MQFFSTVALAAAAFSLSAAAKPQFYIKSQSLHGGNGMYDGLFLTPFHTGAGENVPTFEKSMRFAGKFHFNDTRLETKLGGNFPYGLNFGLVEDLYALWGSMTLDSGDGTKGFEVNDNGYIVTTKADIDFGGWRICDWVHGAPELYYNTEGSISKGVNPSNCEMVHLVKQAV